MYLDILCTKKFNIINRIFAPSNIDRYDDYSETGYDLEIVKKMSNDRTFLNQIVLYNFCEGEIAYRQGRLGEAKTRFQYVVDNGGDLLIREKSKKYIEELESVIGTPVDIKEVKKINKASIIRFVGMACIEFMLLVVLLITLFV